MNDDTVLYFAYGSNADPDRFRARIGPWLSRRVAFLGGYRLRFASSVRSEGGGGAVVDPWEGGRVAGVLYQITAEQLAAMDREEFGATRNVSLTGRRIAATVSTDDGPQPAQLYTVEDDGGWCPPSARYLGFFVRGLEDAGHSPESLEQVRRIARTEPTGS